jgi:hypothetical protein
MPYSLTWEQRGVYRRYFGDVTIRERLESFEVICASPRFDDIRYSITDYLDVEHYEASDSATREIAALHIGPLLTNPRVVIAAVAVKPEIVASIEAFIALNFTSQPYRIFTMLKDARNWVESPFATSGRDLSFR